MDRSLATLLRSLQGSRTHQDSTNLLLAATTLLARLSNPLNVTLLASQILSNPSLFPQPIEVASCRRIFSVFYTAALRFAEAETKTETEENKSNLSRIAWTRAVIRGADEHSPRWRHTLLIGGILLGFEGQHRDSLPPNLRAKIEWALTKATNLTLAQEHDIEPNSYLAIVWVLNVAFPYLSDHHRSLIDYEVLLPQAIEATFFSREGLEHGYWLGAIDADVQQTMSNRFSWSLKSPSGVRVQQIRSRDLVTSLGPLARLIAHSIENLPDPRLLLGAVDRISDFSRNLALSWRQNKLSEVDLSEESDFLDQDTISVSMPVLLHILRNTLFAIVICLRSAVGRLVTDKVLSTNYRAPALATRCLHILRDMYFIAHRFGQTSSSQYAFVHYTAIDILNQYPAQAEQFLTTIRPSESGQIPAHPLERNYDLYFLDLAENFTLALSPKANEDLLIHSAMAYITTKGDKRLLQIYEAAHSVLLAVFSAPQNAEISATHVPFYVETLLQSFPSLLSPRQFRLAIKSIIQIASPPSAISVNMPHMQATILEMLHYRAQSAAEEELSSDDKALGRPIDLSEKSVLLLSLIDALPFIPVSLLEFWLPVVAEQLHKVVNPTQRASCQQRFWKILSNGEMDAERAVVCVAWWTSKGGKELVLYGEIPEEDDEFVMSGGLQSSKL